ILSALANAIGILVVVGAVSIEALRRLVEPTPVAAGTIMAVAACAVVVNLLSGILFLAGRRHDLNLRGAFLHLMADAAVSLGVVLAGAAILLTGWAWLDPAISLVIGVVVVWTTWGLLRDSINLAMDA